jgi:hypothetical protein
MNAAEELKLHDIHIGPWTGEKYPTFEVFWNEYDYSPTMLLVAALCGRHAEAKQVARSAVNRAVSVYAPRALDAIGWHDVAATLGSLYGASYQDTCHRGIRLLLDVASSTSFRSYSLCDDCMFTSMEHRADSVVEYASIALLAIDKDNDDLDKNPTIDLAYVTHRVYDAASALGRGAEEIKLQLRHLRSLIPECPKLPEPSKALSE